MPIFSDLGLYYGGSPAPTLSYITPRYNPFPGPPSHRLPPHSRISKYLPLLPTISESSPLYRRAIPLSRLSSPRPILSLPPYQPPRPIRINTADIDVSTPRRAHRTPNNGDRPGTIKRDRTVVRLQTRHARDQKKKTPGEKLMEKFLIRDKAKVEDTEYKKKVLEVEKNEVEKKHAESIRTPDRGIPVLSQVEVLDRLLVEEQEKVDEEECAASRRGSDAMLQPISDYKTDLEGESVIPIRLQTVKRKKHKKSKSCDLEPTLEIVENKDVPEKSMLQRRNTVKKIRRMSEDILVALDTNSFIPSSKNDTQSMSSVNENIQLSSIKCKPKDTVKTNTTCISLVPVTGETLPPEKKNKPKKGVKGVKNKISIQVSIDNNVGVKQFKNKMLPKFIVDDIRVEETLISKRKLAQKIHYEVVVEDFIESVEKTEKSKTTNKESNLTVNDPTQIVDKVNKSPSDKVTKITKNGIKNSEIEKYTTAKVVEKEMQNSIFPIKENNCNFVKSEDDIVLAKDKVAGDNLTHISIKRGQDLKRVKSIQEQKLTFENRSERESTFSNKETKSMSSIISSSLKETVIEKDKVILNREIIIPNSFNSKTNSSTKENDIPNTQEGAISSAQGTSPSKVSNQVKDTYNAGDTQLFETPTKSYVETFQMATSEKDILNKSIQKTGVLHIKRNEKESLGNMNKIFIKNGSKNIKSSKCEALCTSATKSFVSKSCESKKQNTEKSTIDITANTDPLPPQQEAPIDFWAVLNTSASGTRLNEAYKSIKIINKRAKIRDRDVDISRINEGEPGEEITSVPTPIEQGGKSVPNIQSNIEEENSSKFEVGQFKFKAEVERKKYNLEGKEKKTNLANNFEAKSVVGPNKDQNNFRMKGEKPLQIIKSTMPLNGKEQGEIYIKLASKVPETKVEAINIDDKMKQPHLDAVIVNSKIEDNDFFSQVSIEAISKPATMTLQTKEQRFKTPTDHKNKCLGSTNKGILDSKYETQSSADENCYINPINDSLKSLGETFSEETSIVFNVMESKVDSNRLDINDSMTLPIAISHKTIDSLKCSSTAKEELSHQNVVDTTSKPVQNNLTTNINGDISGLLIGPTEKVDDGDTPSKQSDFIQPGTSELKKSGNIEKVEKLKIFSPPNNKNVPEDKNPHHTNILLSKNLVKNKKFDVLYKINKNIPKDKLNKETEPSPTIKAKISKTKKDSMEKKEQFSSAQEFPGQKPIQVGTDNSVEVGTKYSVDVGTNNSVEVGTNNSVEVGTKNSVDVNIKKVEGVCISNKTSVKLEKQPDTKENPSPSASRSSPKNIEVFEESTQVNLHPDTVLVPSVAPSDGPRELPPNEHKAPSTIVGTSPEEGGEEVPIVPPPPPEETETSSEEEDTETESDDEDEEGSETRETGTPFLATNPDLRLSCEPRDDPPRGTLGRVTPPATSIPHFRKYNIDDFHFLKLLGKGSFGKVLLAELKNTECYYAIKCLKKDVVLEDDDVECTLIERKVLALGTKHPYLCHLFCTFQTDSHLFFVMEYLNGGDLMFHIQQSGKFPEPRACFYGAEIVSGLHFLHKKGIVYRDLKLDNILLDFDGHVRIADFGMCKLQIFLDRTADTFCGTPDYMAPEIIKGLKYNQCVDWWSFGILLYEMLIGQSPFSGCDEDELFWSICNERPHFPLFLSREANSIISSLLQKDSSKRLGTQESGKGEVMDQPFFRKIDWNALERRELIPPFKPRVQHPLDVQYFDKTFTAERAKLTPVEKNILESMDQTQFQGFSYTNPNATD